MSSSDRIHSTGLSVTLACDRSDIGLGLAESQMGVNMQGKRG